MDFVIITLEFLAMLSAINEEEFEYPVHLTNYEIKIFKMFGKTSIIYFFLPKNKLYSGRKISCILADKYTLFLLVPKRNLAASKRELSRHICSLRWERISPQRLSHVGRHI
jgi:hypothetical protein